MSPDEQQGLSRRQFLKLTGATAAAAVIPGGIPMPGSVPEKREQLQETPGTLIVDIAPAQESEKSVVQQNKFIDPESVLGRFSADSDAQLAVTNFLEAYRYHGEMVADAYFDGMLLAGKNPENINVVMEPLQTPEIFNLENLTIETDELGNKTYRLGIPVEELDKIIKAHPEQKIVNLSFPMEAGVKIEKFENKPEEVITEPYLDHLTGKKGYFVFPATSKSSIERKRDEAKQPYFTDEAGNIFEAIWTEDVNAEAVREAEDNIRERFVEVVELATPFVSVSEGYESGRERQVLEKMVQLANQNPDHVIVTSLGNSPVDIRQAREDLADVWPDTLIIMGQWDGEGGEPVRDTHGGDIYIENREINDLSILENAPKIGNGSSFSAGFESGWLDGNDRDLDAAAIADMAKNFAKRRAYQDSDGVQTEVLVLDGDSFKL